jgi:hypothetical protein
LLNALDLLEPLFRQRSDIGREIGGPQARQRHVQHLRMRHMK